MKRKSDIGTWILIIFFIGLVSSLVNSDIPFGTIIENWRSIEIEATLDYLNIGLAFVAFGFLFFLLILWIGNGKKWERLKRGEEENKEDASEEF